MIKKKVVVAMSGGVDSSVAALLMKKNGYDVVGVFLKCWSETKNSFGECSWKDERIAAWKICKELGIPLITVDAENAYRKFVVDEMFKDYRRGITPNPDILCNEVVKFPFLFREAKKLKADYVVTGHYSEIKKNKKGVYELFRGVDEGKDQSYFLYKLKESDLKNLIFPIGRYTKSEVRKIAKDNGFFNHEKKSTVGICFIGKRDMKEFLKLKIKAKKGKILDPDGKVLGEHDGVFYYTIGQRLGPRFDIDIKKEGGTSLMPRWYVAKKNVKKNILVVAPEGHEILFRKEIVVKDMHLINDDLKKFKNEISKKPLKLFARIRHVGELISSKISYDPKSNKFILVLGEKLTGISDGQAVVFYKGRMVLGGGVISS